MAKLVGDLVKPPYGRLAYMTIKLAKETTLLLTRRDR
jgi:hypothetical protein